MTIRDGLCFQNLNVSVFMRSAAVRMAHSLLTNTTRPVSVVEQGLVIDVFGLILPRRIKSGVDSNFDLICRLVRPPSPVPLPAEELARFLQLPQVYLLCNFLNSYY